jgi:drug/metabolite transporter (DMT)-like permease
MWIRAVVGIALIAVGALWIAQGAGAMRGSTMSGHSRYALLGVVVVIIGLAFLGWAWTARNRARQ